MAVMGAEDGCDGGLRMSVMGGYGANVPVVS